MLLFEAVVHGSVHVGANAVVALAVAAARARAWPDLRTFLLLFLPMVMANAIDLDHLLAEDVYVPERCSLGFHPLHSWPAGALYALGLLPPRTRAFALGALTHLAVDAVDCTV